LALAERGNAGLGAAEQKDWLDRFERENDNFRAVLRRAIRGDDAATAVRMGRALASYWHMRSSYSEGRSWMEQITALPSAGERERAVTRIIAAIQAFWQGDFELLDARLDEALQVSRATDDRRVVAEAHLLQVIVSAAARGERRPDELADASRRLEAEGEPLAVGFGLVARAYLARVGGQADEAQHLAQAAYDLSTRSGESYVRMLASSEIARTALELGNAADTQRYAVEALLAARQFRNLNVASYALELWATAELRNRRIERAGRLFALGERGFRAASSHPWRTDAEWHDQLHAELQTALGDRYEQLLTELREVDFDEAIAELIGSQPPTR
jgi:hypothetical protein